jgi:hypothetical protein
VDVYIDATTEALASVFMGYSSLASELSKETMFVTGDPYLIKRMNDWFVMTMYADPDYKSLVGAD